MEPASVTVENVPSYGYRSADQWKFQDTEPSGGGNWFFLIGDPPFQLTAEFRTTSIATWTAIRAALHHSGITGADGAYSDQIEDAGGAMADQFSRERVRYLGLSRASAV